MSDNKLVKTLTDAATVTGLAAGIGFLAKKVINEPMTNDVGRGVPGVLVWSLCYFMIHGLGG